MPASFGLSPSEVSKTAIAHVARRFAALLVGIQQRALDHHEQPGAVRRDREPLEAAVRLAETERLGQQLADADARQAQPKTLRRDPHQEGAVRRDVHDARPVLLAQPVAAVARIERDRLRVHAVRIGSVRLLAVRRVRILARAVERGQAGHLAAPRHRVGVPFWHLQGDRVDDLELVAVQAAA